jgi:hypothetical protein
LSRKRDESSISSESADDKSESGSFHVVMPGSELLDGDLEDGDLDDDVFTPDAWDIAMAIGLDADPDARPALDELVDAMLMWAHGPETDEATARAVDALWSRELETQIADGLSRVGQVGDEWTPAADAAAAEFARDPLGAAVTRAVVQQLAWGLGQDDGPFLFCLCCIEDGLTFAPVTSEERRRRAVAAAILAVRNVEVSEAEVAEALAASAPGRLATDERRRAVRARLGRLGRLGRTSLPALAAELEQIAAEPLPADPAADDVWEVVAHALLANHAKPELN